MSSIVCLGTGYVGLVTGVCLAKIGHSVTCLDINEEKIHSLQRGIPPIFEEGLEQIIQEQNNTNLFFTTSYESISCADVVFLAVGTPSQSDGSVNLSYLIDAARELCQHISGHTTIIIKSTVPVGTNQMIHELLERESSSAATFSVVSNPEFLREGRAIDDFMHPDRIVVGARTSEDFNLLRSIYQGLNGENLNFIESNPETAELIKYASNAFLATKIAFINEMANLSRACNADIDAIGKAMGLDPRIGPEFLKPGPGYGGSCFPKDTRGLSHIAKSFDSPTTITDAVIQSNLMHQDAMVDYIVQNAPKNAQLTLWGLTFKAHTDDTRESPALAIAKKLLANGFHLNVYDPMHKRIPRSILPKNVSWSTSPEQATEASHAVVVLTEWPEFKTANWADIHDNMATPRIFDLRNLFNRAEMNAHSFEYFNLSHASTSTILL